jgi:hypothetical protein
MNNISEDIKKKAQSLFEEGKVKVEFETDKRIHFKVFGRTEEHSVIFDKEKNEWSCDCKYSTLKQKECSHILACKLRQ